jgi:hypothetical protein
MATGLALHIGLNRVDPDRYDGWDGALVACENDARDMARIARAAGFESTVLLTPDCTVAGVTAALDETLVLYDRQFLDDEVQQAFRAFPDGVRIVALLDCCHSGSGIEVPGGGAAAEGTPRYLPEPQQRRLSDRDRSFYEELRRSLAKEASADGAAPDAVLVSACQDNQVASDGDVNGAFTAALLRVWDDGAFTGGYRDFHRAIQRRLPPTQSPNLYLTGTPAPDFLSQRPFTI